MALLSRRFRDELEYEEEGHDTGATGDGARPKNYPIQIQHQGGAQGVG
ncbi:hypothetical protein [Chromobacterium haemolyticum]